MESGKDDADDQLRSMQLSDHLPRARVHGSRSTDWGRQLGLDSMNRLSAKFKRETRSR